MTLSRHSLLSLTQRQQEFRARLRSVETQICPNLKHRLEATAKEQDQNDGRFASF